MTAADLTAAARRIRHDVTIGQAHGDDAFLLAVADWLDEHVRWCMSAHDIRPDPEAVAVVRAYLATP